MTYENLKNEIEKNLINFMPEKYRNCIVNFSVVRKTNITKEGFCVENKDFKKTKITPIIYLEDLYKEYKDAGDINKVMREIADLIIRAEINSLSFKIDDPNFSNEKVKIFATLINTTQNEELLKTLPNRPFLDLSIVYRMLINDEQEDIATAVIGNELAKNLQLSENDLYIAAMENTSKLFPCTIKSMDEIIGEFIISDDTPIEIMEMMQGNIPEEKRMYILSNERAFRGAAFILFEEQLEKVANIIKSDFFIMPASIHECIAISAENSSPEEWAEVVRDANENQVAIEERLSNQVYYYDREAKKLTIATDTENKK